MGWLLPIAVLFGVLWAVAQVLAWPVWVRVTLAGFAAVTVLLLRLRDLVKRRDARKVVLAGRAVTVPRHSDRLPLVREAESTQLRVHSAVVQVRYIERDVQQQVAEAVGPGWAVLLVGQSMAGKTRLAAQVVQQRFPQAPLLVPESGSALRDLVIDEGLDIAGVVVWLDDLERFLAPDGLTTSFLDRLTSGQAILVATIRSGERDKIYLSHNKERPSGWEVLDRFGHDEEGFTQVDVQRRNTPAELDRIRDAVTDPHVLDAVQNCGLGEYLGGGPMAVDKFEHGETTEAVGYALVRVAVDWRRSGLTRAIPKPVLLTPALVSIYLAAGPAEPRSQEALDQGLRWATEEINESVALLGRFPDPAAPPAEAFEALDYLVDHVTQAGAAVPEQLWQVSLDQAQPPEWMNVGYAACDSANLAVAEHAFGKAAEAGDKNAMTVLGVLLQRRGELGEAENWYRHAAEGRNREAMTHLGLLQQRRGRLEEAETWFRRAANPGSGEARDRNAMHHLGVLLQWRGVLDEAETWYRRAANAGHGEAMHHLGVLLQRRGVLEEAETWYRRAASAGRDEAMHDLGELLCLRGEFGEAETWYRRAAAGGHIEAMFNLGAQLAERGKWAEAATWYRRAADAGHAEAMFNLGWLLQHVNLRAVQPQLGEFAEADFEVETWYRRAAEAGHAKAMTRLGKEVICQRGDLSEAEIWYRRAAAVGEAEGMNRLGLLVEYQRGELDEAQTWYRRAAEAGHSEAMFNLGALLRGRGESDEAETWYRRAAATGHDGAKLSLRWLLERRGESEEDLSPG
jgi:TPR repeat protein